MTTWLSDASANRHIKTYVKDFLDVSGNMTIRNADDYAWNNYGQVISGVYESDGIVYFGIRVDMDDSGNTIVVTADNQISTSLTESGVGHVYKYDSNADIWYKHGSQIEFGAGSTGAAINYNGTIVALAGNTGPTSGDTYGRVNVYQYNSSTNTWDAYGTNQSIMEGQESGEKVGQRGFGASKDGNTVAFTERSGTNSIRVFRIVNGAWTQIGTFDSSGYANGSLSYDGSRIVFIDRSNETGLVYDYSGSGTTWTQVGSTITHTGSNDASSYTAINKEGNIIALNEWTNQTVTVYKYDDNTSDWVQYGQTLVDSQGSSGYFGQGIMRFSSDGNKIAISNINNNTLYIFTYKNGLWESSENDMLVGAYTDSATFTNSIGVNENITKIVGGGYGADVNGTDSGYVQAWQWSQEYNTNPSLDISGGTMTMWGGAEHVATNYSVTQLGADIDEYNNNGTGNGERSNTLYFSSDGTTLYIGHQLGYNEYGERTGTFRVMKYRNGEWYRIGSIIAPRESEVGVFQGSLGNTMFSGAGLSSDGTRAMGNWYDQDTDSSTAQKGLIRVYDLSGGDWVQVGNDIEGDSAGDLIASGRMSGDGNTVAYRDSGSTYAKIRTYNSSTNTWDLQTTVSTGNVNIMGLSYDGTIRIDRYTTTSGDYKVVAYKYANGSWSQIGQELKSYEVANDEVYNLVSLSKYGDYLLVGDRDSFSDTGVALVYKYSSEGDIWMQLGGNIQNPFTTESLFTTASSTAISADGKTIIVADYLSQGTVPTTNAGAFAVYKYFDGNWTQIELFESDNSNEQLASGSAMCDNGELFAVSSGGSFFARTYQITNSPALKIENGKINDISVGAGSGANSIILGNNNTASGIQSIAIGTTANALGAQSVSMGYACNATGANTIAIGINSNAYGSSALAIGDSSLSSGNTVAIGQFAQAVSWRSTAIGYGANAAGDGFNTSLGYNTKSAGQSSASLGTSANASSNYATALGASATAGTADQATAIGFAANASGYRSVALGAYASTTTANRIQLGTSTQHVAIDGYMNISSSIRFQSINHYIDTSAAGALRFTNNGVHYWRMNQYSGTSSQVEFRNLSNDNKCTIKALSYSNISDDRVKTNEKLIENATETLMKLRPQTYKQYGNMDCSGETHFQAGLVAQEVHYQAPELRDYVMAYAHDISVNDIQDIDINSYDVQNDPDYEALGWGKTESGVNYIGFIPYIIKSNQEQQEEINTLKSQITDLLARVTSLESS